MGIRRSTFVAIFIAIGGLGISASAQPSRTERLPALRGDSKQVSVSGISAGAFAATQLQVAYSSSLMGVGSVAGGPWFCAKASLIDAYFDCMESPTNIDLRALVQEAKAQARKNHIDPLGALKSARVYLYNSKQDSLVHEPMNEKTKEFFEAFVAKENIATETSIPSGHGFPTLDYGIDCGEKASPYLNKCGFDAAGEILKHIYANRPMTRVDAVSSSLHTFDQTEFGAVGALMDRTGFVYIPEACRRKGAKCAVHVALHGCLQAAEEIGDVFVAHAGYNEWAEGSNIVVLYPQALKSSGNPNGCFDWWGYTGADYATRKGAQMRAIKAMIDRVLIDRVP
jgi:poly(3-hydroxybutyrate) depolymerase